jgi:electron transfer flavoprotein beta subunit
MKILVCISNVPDTTTKIRFTPDNSSFDPAGVQWIINPWDELALTRALQMKEDPTMSIESVTVINVGTVGTEPTIRKALAMGADDAIRINTEPVDAYSTAGQIASHIQQKNFDIIICGIESSDHNGSSVGGMIAEFLNIPSVSAVSFMKIEDNRVIVTRDIDGGREEIGISVPFVAIVQKGIAKEPRIPAMRGIMMARQKPLEVVQPAEITAMTAIEGFEAIPAKAPCKIIDPEDVKQLVQLLQNEARVI